MSTFVNLSFGLLDFVGYRARGCHLSLKPKGRRPSRRACRVGRTPLPFWLMCSDTVPYRHGCLAQMEEFSDDSCFSDSPPRPVQSHAVVRPATSKGKKGKTSLSDLVARPCKCLAGTEPLESDRTCVLRATLQRLFASWQAFLGLRCRERRPPMLHGALFQEIASLNFAVEKQKCKLPARSCKTSSRPCETSTMA